MRSIVISFLLGSFLTAAPAVAFHYLGHDPNGDMIERFQQQQERFNNQWERQQQELFRNQQRTNPC
jgi:hypothetical protein